MSKETSSGDSGPNEAARAWKIVTNLNRENPDEPRDIPSGPSEEFKEESEKFRKIGEEFIPKMTESAKEATGIRDGQDLGEMLQEKASWDKQIDGEVGRLRKMIDTSDTLLESHGKENGRNPITGTPTKDSPFTTIKDPSVEAQTSEAFLNWESNKVCRYVVGNELDAFIYLAAGREAPKVNPDERTKRALKDSVTARFMEQVRGDEEKFKELQNTPTYKIVERMVKTWQDNHDGEHGPTERNSVQSARMATDLYSAVDQRLSNHNYEQ